MCKLDGHRLLFVRHTQNYLLKGSITKVPLLWRGKSLLESNDKSTRVKVSGDSNDVS